MTSNHQELIHIQKKVIEYIELVRSGHKRGKTLKEGIGNRG
jgi:hypothetical protein